MNKYYVRKIQKKKKKKNNKKKQKKKKQKTTTIKKKKKKKRKRKHNTRLLAGNFAIRVLRYTEVYELSLILMLLEAY